MRKNKGYQKDKCSSWRGNKECIKHASGENKTLEQYIDIINKCFDERIETCKKEYTKIATKTTLEGKALYEYCRNWLMWEVKFDINYRTDEFTLVPLEKALEMLENDRRRTLGRELYSKWNGYQKRNIHKDNQKFVYNSGNCTGYFDSIRVPSLKRSDATWKRFYELFPQAKGLKTFRGFKLKKID